MVNKGLSEDKKNSFNSETLNALHGTRESVEKTTTTYFTKLNLFIAHLEERKKLLGLSWFKNRLNACLNLALGNVSRRPQC